MCLNLIEFNFILVATNCCFELTQHHLSTATSKIANLIEVWQGFSCNARSTPDQGEKAKKTPSYFPTLDWKN
jgi:hypothetical protein